jgi:phosphatidylserine/phosphatidylglycerophosphate/cardiolipin synthase-like enzyme
MRFPPRFSCALASLAILVSITVAVPQARAAATHVVISEFSTRGPSSAYDEFAELYNPTDSPVDIGGWKLQYKSAGGTSWSDRAVLPGGASIPARGFYLIAPAAYTGSATPDNVAAAWTTGLSDPGGHLHIINGSAVEVDKVGWGTAIDPEGGSAAPTHTGGNSTERKASATSTAATLASGGLEELAGNGQDTDVNGSDYVAQTNGRHPQNSSNAPEPAFAAGGNGTGRGSVTPSTVFTEHAVPTLAFSVAQDSAYTLTNLAILIPSDWTWSHSLTDVALTGSAFASATPSLDADTLFIAGASVTTADSGLVTVSNLTAPASSGTWTFTLRSAIASGTLTQVVRQPKVRVMKLVPIVTVHVNDPATGVPIAPFAVGSEVTVTGTVTVNWSGTKTSFYLQDGTAGIDFYSSSPPSVTLVAGDSILVTGSITQFRGLTEIQPDFASLQILATGRPAPEPLVLTCAEVNATFHLDGSEPNEGRVVRVNGVTYDAVNSTITDATGTTDIFIPASYPPTPSVFDVIGILQQYKPGTTDPGPPYLADYEISPLSSDHIIPHPGPIILTGPYEDHIQPVSVQLHWTTDVASTSVVRYGLTAALGDSVVDTTPVTAHDVTVPGLASATVYYYSVGSEDVNGANFSTTHMFITASPAQATGEINAYFNKSVDTSLAWEHPANGDQDLVARLKTRVDNARRSIDCAIYSMSGTPGATIASALISAKDRGVKVRVICEYDNRGTAPFNSLVSNGIPLIDDRFDTINYGAGLMHDKFVVVDGRGGAPESTWVWTGSWNLTDPGTNNDYQNSIEVQDQALAVVYTLEFDEMWGSSTDTPNASNSRFGARKLDDTPHKFFIGGHDAACYFSPSDGANWQIVSLINSAEHSVGFQLLTVTRSDIAAALIAQKNAGRKVRGDLDNGTDSGSEYANLVAAGVDVRLKTGSGLLHHKYCIVDADNPGWDGVTLTGSHNWSASAENSNNENTFILHDPDIANQYLQEFAARYYQFGGTDSVRVTDVTPIGGDVPRAVSLAQNSPNPFRGSTSIVYTIPVPQQVSLRFYDLQGRELKTLVDQAQGAGRYRVDLSVRGLASGTYFYRLQVGKVVLQRKTVLLK